MTLHCNGATLHRELGHARDDVSVAKVEWVFLMWLLLTFLGDCRFGVSPLVCNLLLKHFPWDSLIC